MVPSGGLVVSCCSGTELGTRSVLGGDDFGDPASGVEVGFDLHPARGKSAYQVIQDRVGDVLVKNALVPVTLEIELQTFQLDAFFVGSVGNRERRKVGLTRLWADRGELRTTNLDAVISVGELVLERF